MEGSPQRHSMADAEDQAERLRTALEELARLTDAKTIGILREAASDTRSWARAVQDPRGYLAEAGVEVPADTEVNLLIPKPPTSRSGRLPVELDCYSVPIYEERCTKAEIIITPIPGPSGVIDYIETVVCLEKGFVKVGEELYCRTHPLFQTLAGAP